MNTVHTGTIHADKLRLNPYELARRLHTAKGYSDETTESCLKELLKAVDCKFAWVRNPIKRRGSALDLGFGEFGSSDLAKNLTGCDEVFVFAVTLGIQSERLLLRESLLSESRHFITDAIASALAEAACDEAEKIIKSELNCRPRFSPGFGDLSLEIQPKVLGILSAREKLGITLSGSLLMTPSKSITAIMGIKNEKA